MLEREDHKWSKTYFQRKTMTHKIVTKGVSVWNPHISRMKKSIFIELSFLAPFLMLWQKAYSQELFFFLLGMKLTEHFGKSEKQGMELMRSNFSFP